jgi:hypothetical protein
MRLKELSGGIEEDESSFLGAFPKVDFLFPIPKSWLCYPQENIHSPMMGIYYSLPNMLPPSSTGSLLEHWG